MERPPAVAGRFYPAQRQQLDALLRTYLAAPEGEQEIETLALIAPHAGYLYSGAIAGEAYRRARIPGSTILLCPNHTGLGTRTSVLSSGAYRIPGDRVPIDEALAASLRDSAGLQEDAEAHRREHAIEVHVPFLRAKRPDAKIVPVVLGHLSYEECERIGAALAELLRGPRERPLLVASTDMSHFLSAEEAATLDRHALARVQAMDPEGLYQIVRRMQISMCGFIPTTIALIACRELGAREAELLRYGHSGEVSGDHESVVGYASFLVRA